MNYAFATHTLFEWREGQEVMSQIVNDLDPRCSMYEQKPGVRQTRVGWYYLEGLEGYWVDHAGRRITLPWKEV